jgi:SAM-dependent methyltransferase
MMHSADELKKIYAARFEGAEAYRLSVWRTLIGHYFEHQVDLRGSVLDLGCGYGVFINQVTSQERYAMDLNPATRDLLVHGVTFFEQDCSHRWPLEDNKLDVVFTSNFFEHLPDKATLGRTLDEVYRCLKPGGSLIALGPNMRYLAGEYWDFWDHYLPLTERSLAEACELRGFEMKKIVDRFLPYKMTGAPKYPMWVLQFYFKIPQIWRFFGKQFLVIASKPEAK